MVARDLAGMVDRREENGDDEVSTVEALVEFVYPRLKR